MRPNMIALGVPKTALLAQDDASERGDVAAGTPGRKLEWMMRLRWNV